MQMKLVRGVKHSVNFKPAHLPWTFVSPNKSARVDGHAWNCLSHNTSLINGVQISEHFNGHFLLFLSSSLIFFSTLERPR